MEIKPKTTVTSKPLYGLTLFYPFPLINQISTARKSMESDPIDFLERVLNDEYKEIIKEQLGQERTYLENQLLLNQNVIDSNEKGKSDCEIDCTRELIEDSCFDFSSCLEKCRRDFDPLIKSAQDYADRLNKRLRKLGLRQALL